MSDQTNGPVRAGQQNKIQYKAMMSSIHAPAEVLRKAKGIPMEKTKKRFIVTKYASIVCAAVLSVFVVSNGVCYAATGETWVEKATLYINGEPYEMDVHMSQNGDTVIGEVQYTVEDIDGEGGNLELTMMAEGGDFGDTTFEIREYDDGEDADESAETNGDVEAESHIGTYVVEG